MNDQGRNDAIIGDEVIRLSIAAQCGDLPEADANRLNALLAESESARQMYLLAAQDTHDLRDWATEYALRLVMETEAGSQPNTACSNLANAAKTTSGAAVRSRLGWWDRSPLRYFTRDWPSAGRVAAAVALAAVAGVIGWRLGLATHQPRLAGAALESRPSIAELKLANGCSWGGDSPQFTTGYVQARSGDEITLHEGIAEFRLSSDVSLSIEGPVSLVLTSPTSLVLQHGRVTVYVPATVEKFRLVTPACRITGRQAEFGVHVAGGDVDVHAFSGEVFASPALGDEQVDDQEALLAPEGDTKAGEVFTTATIEAGRGLALIGRSDDTVISRWHEADETQFATKLSMAGLLPIADPYVKSVLASKPIGYWRFEGARDGLVPNEIGDKGPLVVVGNVQFAGNASNQVADLGRSSLAGCFYAKNRLDLSKSDYSVELWVKPSHVHTGGCVALLAELPVAKQEQLGFYVQLCGTNAYWESRVRGRFRFLHRNPPGFDHAVGTSCYSAKAYSLRRWQHLAAVKQGTELRLYVDGVLADKQVERKSLPPNLAMVVGELGRPGRRSSFVGQLDELAIYARALSPGEVKEHFESVEWKTTSPERTAHNSI
jgi:hypothetical protein